MSEINYIEIPHPLTTTERDGKVVLASPLSPPELHLHAVQADISEEFPERYALLLQQFQQAAWVHRFVLVYLCAVEDHLRKTQLNTKAQTDALKADKKMLGELASQSMIKIMEEEHKKVPAGASMRLRPGSWDHATITLNSLAGLCEAVISTRQTVESWIPVGFLFDFMTTRCPKTRVVLATMGDDGRMGAYSFKDLPAHARAAPEDPLWPETPAPDGTVCWLVHEDGRKKVEVHLSANDTPYTFMFNTARVLPVELQHLLRFVGKNPEPTDPKEVN